MSDPFDEGWSAAYLGYSKRHNPYKRHTAEWEEWRDGNNMGHKDDPYWLNLKKIQQKIKRQNRSLARGGKGAHKDTSIELEMQVSNPVASGNG